MTIIAVLIVAALIAEIVFDGLSQGKHINTNPSDLLLVGILVLGLIVFVRSRRAYTAAGIVVVIGFGVLLYLSRQ